MVQNFKQRCEGEPLGRGYGGKIGVLEMARLTHEPGVAATFAGAQRGGDIMMIYMRPMTPVSIRSRSTALDADSCQGEP